MAGLTLCLFATHIQGKFTQNHKKCLCGKCANEIVTTGIPFSLYSIYNFMSIEFLVFDNSHLIGVKFTR